MLSHVAAGRFSVRLRHGLCLGGKEEVFLYVTGFLRDGSAGFRPADSVCTGRVARRLLLCPGLLHPVLPSQVWRASGEGGTPGGFCSPHTPQTWPSEQGVSYFLKLWTLPPAFGEAAALPRGVCRSLCSLSPSFFPCFGFTFEFHCG